MPRSLNDYQNSLEETRDAVLDSYTDSVESDEADRRHACPQKLPKEKGYRHARREPPHH